MLSPLLSLKILVLDNHALPRSFKLVSFKDLHITEY